ncbi:MAG TPA: TonB-dependent receptor [Sphingobium sp.]
MGAHHLHTRSYTVTGRLLASTVIATGLFAVPAYGQATALPPAPSTLAPGQDSAAQGSGTPSADDIIVTGVRGSIQRAQDIKRQAVTVVEAISTEDLGKFSDQSIGDALARVPGLQIQRNDDVNSGDRISIRGLGPGFVSVTLNGRETLSYGDGGSNQRIFNFDSLPSEILTNVLVYKSSQAEQVEPGIAGQIDLRTLRPLDQKKEFFGGLSGQGSYDDIAKAWTPRVSGYLGTKLLDDTFGVYVSGVWSDSKYRQDSLTIDYVNRNIKSVDGSGAITTVPNILVPSIENFVVRRNERKRLVLNGALQFKPSDTLDINLDMTYNKYDIDQDNPALRFSSDTIGTTNGELPTSAYKIVNGALVYIDTSQAQYNLPGDVMQSTSNYVAPQNILDTRRIEQYNGGANIAWHKDRTAITADFGYSEVNLHAHDFTGLTFAPPATFIYDGTKPTQPNITILQNSFQKIYDPTVYVPSYDLGNSYQFHSVRYSYRLDAQREVAIGEFEMKLKVGARFAKTKVDYRSGGFFDLFGPYFNYPTIRYPNGTAVPGGAYTPDRVNQLSQAMNIGDIVTPFQGSNFGGYNGSLAFPAPSFAAACTFLSTDYCGLSGPRSAFGQASFSGAFPTSSNPLDAAPINASSTYLIKEQNLAFYGQADFKGAMGALTFDGSLGLRAVRITERTQGFVGTQFRNDRVFNIQTAPDRLDPVTDGNRYTEYLPTASLNVHPQDNMTLRFNAAKTLTLPDYAQLSPTSNTTKYFGGPAYDPTRPNDSSGGNTQLKPITSWNFDFTTEYYTPNNGAIVVSLFYKKIKNFIITSTTLGTVAGQGDEIFTVTSPLNFSVGSAKGFEIGFNQPFTFLSSPFDGLGVQGAYTYVDSRVDNFSGSGSSASSVSFPGSSKHNINAIAYFEKWGFSFRAAYNYRTSYLIGTPLAPGAGIAGTNAFTRPETRVDLSASYAILPQIEIFGSATNVTGQGRSDYLGSTAVLRAIYNRPRTYTIGLRGKF